jgi:hypothetical protein
MMPRRRGNGAGPLAITRVVACVNDPITDTVLRWRPEKREKSARETG